MPPVTVSPNGLDHYRCAAPPTELLVATVDGVVELRNAGGEWRQHERTLGGMHASALLVDAPRGRHYVATHDNGVFRRTGGGAWIAASAGISERNVFSLALLEPGGAPVLFAGTEPALLFVSRNGAETWMELPALRAIPGRESWNFPVKPNLAHAKHVDADPRDPQTFYLAIEQGALLKTNDGGQTFRELSFAHADDRYNKDVHRVVVNPHDPDELYLTGGDGIAHSRDAGETWERIATPAMRIGYPDAMFCSPETDGVLYVAGAGARPGRWRETGDADAAFVRSTDRGMTWEMIGLPALRGNIEAVTLVEWPGGYGFFAGTTDGEIFVSVDRGSTWSALATGLPAVSKCVHAQNLVSGRR
jgi:photosystem II stability/assembly factor-like uncharacterized protein